MNVLLNDIHTKTEKVVEEISQTYQVKGDGYP